MNRALVEGLLVGAAYPARAEELAAYAQEHGAAEEVVAALEGLPDGEYRTTNDVGEALAPVEPDRGDPEPPPRPHSGGPPGGDAYVAA